MYFRNPNMTQEDGIRPTEEGLQLSPNVFLVAIGAGLVAMDASDGASKLNTKRKIKKAEKRAEKRALKAEN